MQEKVRNKKERRCPETRRNLRRSKKIAGCEPNDNCDMETENKGKVIRGLRVGCQGVIRQAG